MTINHNKNLANELANQILNEIQMGNNITPAHILQASMNMLMLAERQLHLEQNPHDKGNGTFERKLGTPLGELTLTVPRDRDSDFRPAILPEKYYRDYAERESLLESLLINGYSPQQIQRTLNELHLHYNPEEIEALKNHYTQLFNQWQNRELPHDIIGLFIDAYHADALVEQKVRKAVIYVAIGIDFNGHKSLYGIYLYTGSETRGFWLQTLNQLIHRGLKAPLFVISDDFPGLKETIDTLFPKAYHQLCFIHMQRNTYKNMAKPDAHTFNQALNSFKLMNDPELAKSQFSHLCEQYQKKYPAFMETLVSKKDRYFAFLHLPQEVTKYFYTTHLVESFNSILEKTRQRMGGFFQSEDCLKLNVFLTLRRLHENKWQKGVPLIISQLYSLRQLFAQRYERLPIETKTDSKFNYSFSKLSLT
jgi:putative transposase